MHFCVNLHKDKSKHSAKLNTHSMRIKQVFVLSPDVNRQLWQDISPFEIQTFGSHQHERAGMYQNVFPLSAAKGKKKRWECIKIDPSAKIANDIYWQNSHSHTLSQTKKTVLQDSTSEDILELIASTSFVKLSVDKQDWHSRFDKMRLMNNSLFLFAFLATLSLVTNCEGVITLDFIWIILRLPI